MDWHAVAGGALEIVLGVCGSALATLVVLAVHKLAARWHVALSVDLDQRLRDAAQTAVRAAEEWARTQADKPTGSAKADFALRAVKDIVGSQAFQQYAEPKIRTFLDSAVNTERTVESYNAPIVPPSVSADLGLGK